MKACGSQIDAGCRWTSIGLPPRERRKRPAAPIDRASPAPSSEIPPAKAFAINTGISAKASTETIASLSSPITAVSSSPLRWRRCASTADALRSAVAAGASGWSHSHKIAGRIRQQPRQLLCAMSAANRIVRVIEVSGGAPHCQFRPPPPDDAGFPTGRAL